MVCLPSLMIKQIQTSINVIVDDTKKLLGVIDGVNTRTHNKGASDIPVRLLNYLELSI